MFQRYSVFPQIELSPASTTQRVDTRLIWCLVLAFTVTTKYSVSIHGLCKHSWPFASGNTRTNILNAVIYSPLSVFFHGPVVESIQRQQV